MKRIAAPRDPASTARARVAELAGRGGQRTPAQTAELIDLLAGRVADLEQRLERLAAGR